MRFKKTLSFNTKGYDGFIDFIKAYAIICVLFGHTFLWNDDVAYGLWAGMQVPLFVIVQSFHFYKKQDASFRIFKIFKRVVVPFVIVTVLTFVIAFIIGKGDAKSLFKYGMRWGGFGPGSYFPWIYVQIAILLPLFRTGLEKYNGLLGAIVLLLISETFEILFSLTHLSDNIFRLFVPRYLFLLYFGWSFSRGVTEFNWKTTALALLSAAAIVYFEYCTINSEPWFYNTDFKFHRWPCYLWLAYGLIPILYGIWSIIKKNGFIERVIQTLAKCSYEVFLLQMALLFLLQKEDLSFISNSDARYVVWVVIVWISSIVGGYCWNILHIKYNLLIS